MSLDHPTFYTLPILLPSDFYRPASSAPARFGALPQLNTSTAKCRAPRGDNYSF